MILPWLLACASLEPVDPEAPCLEAGYAIAWRTFDCTGDEDLANARYELFAKNYEYFPIVYPEIDVLGTSLLAPADTPGNYFHCAFLMGELACELVDQYGDDLDLWLSTSPTCDLVVR
jgi:hypothetical protein